MANVPEDLQYSAEHEWVDGEAIVGGEVTVGITEHAADALGDIVYVEGPALGTTVTAGEVCGELESTKAVSELYSPVTGTVIAVNEELASTPENVNSDPFGTGWIFKVEVAEAPTELLDAAAYGELTA
jgi:glycine cleavage system H protein